MYLGRTGWLFDDYLGRKAFEARQVADPDARLRPTLASAVVSGREPTKTALADTFIPDATWHARQEDGSRPPVSMKEPSVARRCRYEGALGSRLDGTFERFRGGSCDGSVPEGPSLGPTPRSI